MCVHRLTSADRLPIVFSYKSLLTSADRARLVDQGRPGVHAALVLQEHRDELAALLVFLGTALAIGLVGFYNISYV